MQKAKETSIFVSGIGNDLTCPFFNSQGKLHVVKQNAGTVISIDISGNTQLVCSTNGQPSGGVFSNDDVLYVADFAHSGILSMQIDNQQDLVVGVYEDRPLKGPHSVQINNGDIYFTDSGSFGETGLQSRTGSLFTIANSPTGQILRPIAYESLAYPSGIAITKNGKFIYVAEMMANRIIRFFQQPAGVFHASVFHQFSGGVGPSCLVLDNSVNENLYVGHYEVKESNATGGSGLISILSADGKIQSTIATNGPEISGITISSDGILYITEKSTGSIQKFRI